MPSCGQKEQKQGAALRRLAEGAALHPFLSSFFLWPSHLLGLGRTHHSQKALWQEAGSTKTPLLPLHLGTPHLRPALASWHPHAPLPWGSASCPARPAGTRGCELSVAVNHKSEGQLKGKQAGSQPRIERQGKRKGRGRGLEGPG